MPFKLSENDKFALIAVHMVYTELPGNDEMKLPDGTWMLTNIPIEIASIWQKWIGSIKADKLKESNLVLVRTMQSQNPRILDDEHKGLAAHLSQFFSLLQFGGVLEYGEADILKGSFYNDTVEIRQHSVILQFYPSKGYTRTPVTLPRLKETTKLRDAIPIVYPRNGDFARLGRGLNIATDSLKQKIGQEKLHQAVRSLEALILPDTGNTRKQFVHRCQTFAKAGDSAAKVLGEAFDMRSDAEHIHNWERSLSEYDPSKRHDVAWQRTRQMEALSSFAYSRILREESIRTHFKDESVLENFWKKIDDAERRKIWGKPFDLDSVPMHEVYDGFGRGR